jgi:hypothetical protein
MASVTPTLIVLSTFNKNFFILSENAVQDLIITMNATYYDM